MKYFVASFLVLFTFIAGALGMADFVPNFLMPGKANESVINDSAIKPLVNTKRNSSASKSWYCNRIKNGATNIFCNKNTSSSVAKIMTYDNNDGDKTSVVDNSVSGNYAQTSSNQTALQDQQTKNLLQRNQQNFSVPIRPSKDVNMNVNQQQIQINIKY